MQEWVLQPGVFVLVNMVSSVQLHSHKMRTYWLHWSGMTYNGSTDNSSKADPNTTASQNRLIVL